MANQRQHAAAPQLDRAKHRGGRRGILLAAAAAAFMFLGVVAVALTNAFVNYTSTDSFCGTTCHSMTWAAETYKRSPHFDNRFGVRVTCGDCHIPYDSSHPSPLHYVGLLLFKADRGAKDVWGELTRRIRTEEDMGETPPAAGRDGRNLSEDARLHHVSRLSHPRGVLRSTQCHEAARASGRHHGRRGRMLDVPCRCRSCRRRREHVEWRMVHPAAGRRRSPGLRAGLLHVPWRWVAWAGGPALVGQPFWHAYGGQRVSTLWSAVHTQMPMSAPGSVSVQDSIDIMAFLLQQNGVASGATPLDDTVDLTNVLPPQ